MGCGASAEVEKKQYAFRVRLLGGLNLYNNGFGVQAPGTYTNAGRFEGASDPYCVLECTGSKQRHESQVRLGTQNPVWNEEYFFNTSTKAPIITITVKDKDVLSGDDVLGVATINLHGLISRTAERTIWSPLSKTKAGGEIGIAVVEAFRTNITAKQGVDVQPMDTLSGSSDVYMTLQVGQQAAQKTATKSWTLNPVWNQTFTFFVPYGIKSQVAMILYDHDSVGVDKNMGWHYEYFNGVPQKGPRELNVAIENAKGKLHLVVEDDEQLQEVQEAPALTDEIKAKFPSELPTSCTFDVRVLGAYNLAAADHNYASDFASSVNSWGWHEFKEYSGTSDPFARVTCEGSTYDTRHINGTLEPVWNEKFRFVCRDRQKNSLKVEVLDHDLAVNDSIGAVSIPLAAMKPGRRQEIWSYLDKGRGEIGVEVVQHHQINVRIVSAAGLPAKDMNGMCDPYVKVILAGTTHQTRVVRNDRNPWIEEEFRFCLPTLNGLKLRLEAWDSDLMIFKKGMSEDLLGVTEVDVSNLIPGLPTEMDLPLNISGKLQGTLKVVLTEEVPMPESVLGDLKKKGKEAFEASVRKMNEVKEMVSCMKLPDFDKKEEAVYEVADAKLAPRPRFTHVNVEIVALRKLQGISEPYYMGVSCPLQGKRFKTTEVRGASGVDVNQSFDLPIPSKLTGAIELTLFESTRHPYLDWSTKSAGKHQLLLSALNKGEGTIRGSKANDEWLDLRNEKGEVVGQVIVRVTEVFRFQVRVIGAKDLKTKKEPYVTLQLGDVSRFTSYVSEKPEKERTTGTVGKPIWDEQFTFFAKEKGIVEFKLMELGMTSDQLVGKASFDLGNVRRGVPHKADLVLSTGGTLQIEVLEEEKMALLDQLIDGAANAAKLATALAGEVGAVVTGAVGNAATALTGAFGKLF
jgi:hypothetical protein